MAEQSRLFFNSNINVDVVKVSRKTSLTFKEALTQKNKMGGKITLFNTFNEQLKAYYFPPLAEDRDAVYNIYRKTPEQTYYDYVFGLTEEEYAFIDYNVKANEWYHYLAAAQVPDLTEGYRYFMFENNDEHGNLNYMKASWDSWSIQDIEDTDTENLYTKTGTTWLLGLNYAENSITQNTNVMSYETLGQFGKYGIGKKNFQSGTYSGLLGSMKEVYVYNEETKFLKYKDYRYTEKDDETSVYSREMDKLNRWKTFVYNGKLKLLKDFKGNAWIIQILSNPSYDINYQGNSMPTTISFEWQEALDFSKVAIVTLTEDE